jgi:hypothetical protein
MTEDDKKSDEEVKARRVFTNAQGHRSGVLRSKRGEAEEAAKDRLSKKGWNMEAPHNFSKSEDDTGVFRVTDKKIRKRKPKATVTGKPDPESEDATPDEGPSEDEPKSEETSE